MLLLDINSLTNDRNWDQFKITKQIIIFFKKIEELMKEAMESQSKNIDLEMIKSYTKLKMRLFEKLNRVI